MKKNKFIGLVGKDKDGIEYGAVLESPYNFDDFANNLNSIETSDFSNYSATDWCGADEIERTLKIRSLNLTGRKLKLIKPLEFSGYDDDMWHRYDWTKIVIEIWEATEKGDTE